VLAVATWEDVSVVVTEGERDCVCDAVSDGVCVKLEVRDCDLVPDALELPDTEALTVAEGDCDPDTLADCVSVGVTVRVPDILPTWLGVWDMLGVSDGVGALLFDCEGVG